MSEPNYREILIRMCEKLVRQRDFWQGKGASWRYRSNHPTPEDDDPPDILDAKAFVIDHCARDLDFGLGKTLARITTEDKCEIIRLADETRARIIANKVA
jgi:hypothetical protein